MKMVFFYFSSIIFFGWLSFYGCTSPPEKINSLSIEVTIDTTQATIGDVILFTVEVKGVSNQNLIFSELHVENPIEIRGKSIFKEENKIQFQIVIWDTGTFAIPGYTVGISHVQDSTLDYSLETIPLEITVLSTLTEDSMPTLKPIKGPVPIVYPTPWEKIAQWSFLILAILLLFFAWSKRKIYDSFIPVHYKNIQSPFNRAIERLGKLSGELDDKTFYVNLSHILREFVEHSIFIKSLEMTTEEIITNKSIFSIENSLIEQWISLLSRADQIKYARRITSQDQRIEDIKWSKEFLQWGRAHWELT